MRRLLLGLMAAVLIASGSTLVATPAQAATKPVTIKKLGTQWIGWDGVAVVKPNVKKAKKVKIVRKALTVQQGAKVIRRNKTSVKLKVGTYRLTTKVTYKVKGKKRTAVAKQRLVVKQGRCAVRADYAKITVSRTLAAGDVRAVVDARARSRGIDVGSYVKARTLTEWRELAVEMGDPEGIAMFDDYIARYGATAALHLISYTACNVKTKTVDVVFIEGHAIEKYLQ